MPDENFCFGLFLGGIFALISGLIIGCEFTGKRYQKLAIEANVGMYDPVTAEFKFIPIKAEK